MEQIWNPLVAHIHKHDGNIAKFGVGREFLHNYLERATELNVGGAPCECRLGLALILHGCGELAEHLICENPQTKAHRRAKDLYTIFCLIHSGADIRIRIAASDDDVACRRQARDGVVHARDFRRWHVVRKSLAFRLERVIDESLVVWVVRIGLADDVVYIAV